MLKKLFKYDAKNLYKFLIIFYALTIFFSITTRIFLEMKSTFMINLIANISKGFMYSMMASSLINTIMRSWVRFKETIYGDESYLTHTLPITKNTIFNSKYLLSLVSLLSTFLVIITGLLIAFYTPERIVLLKDYILNLSNSLNANVTIIIISILFILFLEIMCGMSSGLLGIILGHKKQNKKVGYSVLDGFLAYMVTQIISVLFLAISGTFNKEILDLFTTNNIPSIHALQLVLITGTLAYLIINASLYIISTKLLKKGVNVE